MRFEGKINDGHIGETPISEIVEALVGAEGKIVQLCCKIYECKHCGAPVESIHFDVCVECLRKIARGK